MPHLAANTVEPAGGFPIRDMMMRYNVFVPRLYNWCKSLGFTPGKVMPSRAFCSHESQGYHIIMMAKHFGTFPFNHGVVGGIVATDRHAPHATHGQDMLIVQASHVGYDPENQVFGTYRRAQTTHMECSLSCGKIQQVISWYQNEYEFARHNILPITSSKTRNEASNIPATVIVRHSRVRAAMAPACSGFSQLPKRFACAAHFPGSTCAEPVLPSERYTGYINPEYVDKFLRRFIQHCTCRLSGCRLPAATIYRRIPNVPAQPTGLRPRSVSVIVAGSPCSPVA